MNKTFGFLSPLFVTLSMVSTAQADLSLATEPQALTAENQKRVTQFLTDIDSLLPVQLKKVLNRTITIKFRNLSGRSQLTVPACSGDESAEQMISGGTLGRVLKGGLFTDLKKVNSIELDFSILNEILVGKSRARTFPCSHGSTYKIAQAVLLHEIAHVYDFANYQSSLNQKDIDFCKSYPKSVMKQDYVCKDLLETTRSISNHPYFKHLMGWFEKGLLVQSWTNLTEPQRSPDPYELANPEEALGVNFEFFILDPTYQCRRPVQYAYFKNQFSHTPYAASACETYRKVSFDSESTKAQVLGLQTLTTENLYSIDYLYADQGDALMSRWGHAMYRLVYCKPGRPVGPECRNDISNHIVISYRAQVDDMQIDQIAGLRGDYPSKMYLLAMADVIDDYTKGEFRDLVSLPLNLSKEETERFIHRTLEQYWAYRGYYYFLSANCANEALNLLKAARYSADLQRLHVNTPLGLYDAFKARRIVDANLVTNKAAAKNASYLIPGADENLNKAFEILKSQAPHSPIAKFSSTKEYTKTATVADRKALADALIANPKAKAEQIKLLGAALVLENQILRNAERNLLSRLSKELFDYVQGLNPDGEVAFVGTKLEEYKKIMKETKANSYSAAGYGIPLEQEIADIQNDKEDVVKNRLPELSKEIIDWAHKNLVEENAAVEGSTEIRSALVKAIAQIARAK